MDALTTWFVPSVVAILVAGVLGYAWKRRRQEARDTLAFSAAVARNQHEPASLHPVIDPDICIGSLSCLKACPEGDILGVVDGAARLIRGSNCIGHGKCALECPVGAIRLVFGTSERGVDLPEVDETFQSSRAGVHIVGELGGMGLIRNAVTQGVEAAQYIAAKLSVMKAAEDPTTVDVAIVGAGPAGIATALGCREAGLTFRVLDQQTLGGTVASYPRQKIVMTETVMLPIIGKFGRSTISKEELVATFEKACAKAKIQVEEGVKVEGLDGGDGAFTLKTTAGEVRARKVVLAVGRRGSPRKLGAPGEDLPKVTYRLLDAEQYEGCRMLVVGGGDSALEAAIQLAEESDATVALSYRGEAFGKCREANRQRIEALAASGRVKLLMGTTIAQVLPESVELRRGDERITLPNDYVIACLGGELPLEFLKKMGVGVRRLHGEELRSQAAPPPLVPLGKPSRGPVEAKTASVPAPVPVVAKAGKGSAREEADGRHRRLAWSLFILGAAILVLLMWVGGEYYTLPPRDRLRAPDHASLKPAGIWGHGVGMVATAFMLSNFLYALRKRWSRLKGSAPIRTWLTFHVFVGFMSPLVIVFHAAFQSNNQIATATFAALLVVVVTGIIGRYIFGLVPAQGGSALEHAEVLAQFERMKAKVGPFIEELADPSRLKAIFAEATEPAHARSLPSLLLRRPFDQLRLQFHLWRVRREHPDWEHGDEFDDTIRRLVQLRDQVRFFKSLKKLLAGWRALHAVLAVFLVVTIAVHIAISLFLGYTWIF